MSKITERLRLSRLKALRQKIIDLDMNGEGATIEELELVFSEVDWAIFENHVDQYTNQKAYLPEEVQTCGLSNANMFQVLALWIIEGYLGIKPKTFQNYLNWYPAAYIGGLPTLAGLNDQTKLWGATEEKWPPRWPAALKKARTELAEKQARNDAFLASQREKYGGE